MKNLKYVLLMLPFLLGGCLDHYEPVRVTAFPYGNARTAGSAIAYVQAAMLPEKTLKMPELRSPAMAADNEHGQPHPEEEETELLQEIEEDLKAVFQDKQKK